MDSKIKILVISEVFYPEIGSGANRITNLVTFLKEQGNKVDVVTSEPSYPDKSIYNDSSYKNCEKEEKIYIASKVIRVKGSKLKPTSNFFNRLYIYLYYLMKSIFTVIFLEDKYDVVITTVPSIFMGILGVVAKVRFKAKLILDIRDLWPECIKNIGVFRKHKTVLKVGYALEKMILKFTDSAVVNSEAYKWYLEKNKYNKPIIFIPNSLTMKEFKELEQVYNNTEKDEVFTVIYAGLIGLAQNVTSIVRVANHLRKVEGIKFKIIGTGVQRQKVLDLIEHYNLNNIEVCDPMPKYKVIKEISKSHVALVHLRKDSAFDLAIPGKLIDYMGIGIPIIAGIEGYTASILVKSEAGIVVEPDNYIEMARSILYMYKNDSKRNEYSYKGQAYCKENFLLEENFYSYIKLINKLLGRESNENKNMYVCMESLY